MLSAGDRIRLEIEKPAVGGRMIARHDGQVVLVAGAIPGEEITAVIERIAKGVAYANALSIEVPSGDRRHIWSDPLCGGCLFSFIAYERQLELKAAIVRDAFKRIARIEMPDSFQVAPSPESGYRMRARFHVRGGRAGFFREGTHALCDPRQTQQLLPATCDALDRLMAASRSFGDRVDCELELAENVEASERVVLFDATRPLDGRRIDRLAGVEGISGVVCGPSARGNRYVADRIELGGSRPVRFRRDVAAFFQGNRYLLHGLLEHVAGHVPAGCALLDLYAGVGLFAVSAAAARGARVAAVEGDRVAAADLAANAAPFSDAIESIHQPVERFLSSRPATVADGEGGGVDCVIVDPPRTGMSREALGGLLALAPARLIYVSCDVATLARDAGTLVEGGYEIVSQQGFDLFPNTPHVETVVTFENAPA